MNFRFGKKSEAWVKHNLQAGARSLGFSSNQLDDKSNLLRIVELFNEDSRNKVMLVCSNNRKNNGMNFTRNIGKASSSLGKKTLVIDCDFKDQSLTKSFQFNKNTVGLTNVLEHQDHVMDAVNEVEPQLQILTTGSIVDENQFILKFSNFKNIIDVYRSYFDLIVINTTEDRNSFFSEILYHSADQVVYVTQANAEKKDDIRSFKKLIESQSSQLLGVVFDG